MTDHRITAAIDAATHLLTDEAGQPSATYRAYLEHQQQHESARQTYQRAQVAALADPLKADQWPIESRTYQQGVDNAWNQWMVLGHKTAVEQAINLLTIQGINSGTSH